MTRKTRRRNKSQGADLEAQSEDEGVYHNNPPLHVLYSPLTLLYKEVRPKSVHEMSTLTPYREGESPEATGSNVPVGYTVREATQAVPSTQSQVRARNDDPANSSKHSTVS